MTRRQLKKVVLDLLAAENLTDILEELDRYRETDLLGPLFSALCSLDERVRWHAVSAFGKVVPRIARQDMEAGRVVMRRFLWSLNDESGGIGWGAPEAMAEIMLQHEPLAREYLHMLVSYMRQDGPDPFQDGNFIELPQLQQGVLWGIGRLCPAYGQFLRDMGIATDLQQYLDADEGSVRGLAARCLGLLGETSILSQFPELANDQYEIRLYHDGEISELAVADIVRQSRGLPEKT